MAAFEDIQTIWNDRTEPVSVWLEPWAFEYTVAPGKTLRIVGSSEQDGRLEVVNYDLKIGVYAWPGAGIKTYLDDEVIDELPEWSNDLPPSGKTYRQFIEDVFGGPGGTELR